MRAFAVALCALLLLCACGVTPATSGDNHEPPSGTPMIVDVLIPAGDSVARGSAGNDGRTDTTIPFLDWLPGSTQPYALGTLGPSIYAQQGCEIQAALDLKAAGRTVAVVKIGADGSRLAVEWAPLERDWAATQLAIRVGMDLLRAYYPTGTVFRRHLFWILGHNDASNSAYAVPYPANMRALLLAAKTNLAIERQYVLKISSVPTYSPNYKSTVQNAQILTAGEDSTYQLIDPDVGLPSTGNYTGIHYTLIGYNALGAYWATKVLATAPTQYAFALAPGARTSSGVAPIFRDPDSVLDYSHDWSLALAPGESIASSSWSIDIPDGLAILTNTFSANATTVWLTGAPLTRCLLTNRIVTNSSPARVYDRTWRVVRIQTPS